MGLIIAYLSVVLIWSTTPIAIKLSSIGLSFVEGAAIRMSIGAFCLLLLSLGLRHSIRFDAVAIKSYIAVTFQLFLSMMLTYWSAQFIPSGWVSVIFGLSPMITAILAAFLLNESSLGLLKVIAYLIGFTGLWVMCITASQMHITALIGIFGILTATTIHSISAIWIKRLDAQIPALQQISGGMVFSLPLYWISWYLLDGEFPTEWPPLSTIYSVLYLGVIATTAGFISYYFVLRRMTATKVAMINLMTPMFSLWIGYVYNQEPVNVKVVTGTAFILLSLLIYQLAEILTFSSPIRLSGDTEKTEKQRKAT